MSLQCPQKEDGEEVLQDVVFDKDKNGGKIKEQKRWLYSLESQENRDHETTKLLMHCLYLFPFPSYTVQCKQHRDTARGHQCKDNALKITIITCY